MSKSDQDSKVTLEDLLHLKRAERPGPDFWKNFESELRQKQLTALVRKRHWWYELPVLLNRKVYLPAGAAAIVAFTLVTVRYSVPTQMAQGSNVAPAITAENSSVEMLAATEILVSGAVINQSGHQESPVVSDSISVPSTPLTRDVAVTPSVHSMPREAAGLVANLTRLESSEPDFGEGLGTGLGAPARVQPASVVESEVASLTAPSSSKYRLIARYVDRSLSPAPAAPAVVRERLARRLGDDLNDDISRIGVVGSRVSLKF